jgi:hypothetical protein
MKPGTSSRVFSVYGIQIKRSVERSEGVFAKILSSANKQRNRQQKKPARKDVWLSGIAEKNGREWSGAGSFHPPSSDKSELLRPKGEQPGNYRFPR